MKLKRVRNAGFIELVSELVGVLSPVNHKGLHQTSGLNTNLNFTLSPSYSFHKSSYHKSCFFFIAYLHSVGTQYGNLHPAGWPILFCGPTQELYFSHSQRRKKSGDVLQKNEGEWTGRVEISKEEIPGSKRSMYGYILSYSRLKRRTFEFCVLIRRDFNFYVRSSPLRGGFIDTSKQPIDQKNTSYFCPMSMP